MLDSMPVVEWNGGKVHILRDSVRHLMRGQVFTIDGKKIFAFGGADTIYKERYTEGKDWWRRELPSDDEYQEGLANLQLHNFEIDYIITHTCPAGVWNQVKSFHDTYLTPLENYLQSIYEKVNFKHWYFGHFHQSMRINDKITALYYGARLIDDYKNTTFISSVRRKTALEELLEEFEELRKNK